MEKLTCKWKYLRETNAKYFDISRNTSLCDYLSAIFPHSDFVYNTSVPKEIIQCRNSNAKYRRYRPDARCENLNLIVEFDGVNHYQDTEVVLADYDRDIYFTDLGYRVVRIPYWIQLSNDLIHHLFNISVKEPMCDLIYSFYDSKSPISICPGNMCKAGQVRFITEFTKLPKNLQKNVLNDLDRCISMYSDVCCVEYVVPTDVYRKLLSITFGSNYDNLNENKKIV